MNEDSPFIEPLVSFDDVVGLKAVKQTLHHLASSIRHSIEKPELGAMSCTFTVLLYGPPGTGKTLLAAAMARECGARFISINCDRLLFGCTKYSRLSNVGKVKALFAIAAEKVPCTILLEGVDAVVPLPVWMYPSMAFLQLLKELDEARNGLIIVASATNRASIEPSLLSRFRYQLEVNLPEFDRSIEFKTIVVKPYWFEMALDALKKERGKNRRSFQQQLSSP